MKKRHGRRQVFACKGSKIQGLGDKVTDNSLPIKLNRCRT